VVLRVLVCSESLVALRESHEEIGVTLNAGILTFLYDEWLQGLCISLNQATHTTLDTTRLGHKHWDCCEQIKGRLAHYYVL